MYDSLVYGLVQVSQARPFYKNMCDVYNNEFNNFATKTEWNINNNCVPK